MPDSWLDGRKAQCLVWKGSVHILGFHEPPSLLSKAQIQMREPRDADPPKPKRGVASTLLVAPGLRTLGVGPFMSVLDTRGSHGRSVAETRSRGGGACGGRGGGLGRGGAGARDLGECFSERSDLDRKAEDKKGTILEV